jgi:acyl-CoA synthetase (AMP-forming)/AMP-acid ligase II
MSTLPHGAPFADNTRHGDTPPGSVGLLWPGMTARIVGADDVDAAPGTTGELWLAGPNIVQGYWRDAKKTAETFVHVDGVRWLQTGDVFRVDENGNYL